MLGQVWDYVVAHFKYLNIENVSVSTYHDGCRVTLQSTNRSRIGRSLSFRSPDKEHHYSWSLQCSAPIREASFWPGARGGLEIQLTFSPAESAKPFVAAHFGEGASLLLDLAIAKVEASEAKNTVRRLGYHIRDLEGLRKGVLDHEQE